MTVSKYLKALLDRAAEIGSQLKRIESAENRDAMQLRHGIGSVYPAMFGEISAVIGIAGRDITLALQQIEHVERLERIESALESLDINLSDEVLVALELLASERRHRHARATLSNAIGSAIADVQESERERERDNAVTAITEAGFAYSDDDSGECWRRGNERIQIEMKYRDESTTYTWEIDRDGVIVASGVSGEFSRLLSAISPVAQEVTARKTSGCESPQGPPETLASEVPMVAD